MFRPSNHSAAASKSAGGTGGGGGTATKTSPNKQVSSNNDSSNAPSTIREIRSRTIGGSVAAGSARQLLAYRRQAMSMERLNGSASPKTSSSASMNNINNLGDNQTNSNNNNKNEKLSSPMNGSSNSISGSTASSPSRGSSSGGGSGGGGSTNGGLNRTASRVSRFRSAKAVFERLSSANNSQTSLTKPETRAAHGGGSSLKGTVASRYAAAAAARGVIGQQNLNQSSSLHQSVNTSPRSRLSSNQRASASGQKSPTVSNSNSPKQDQPKPQPRVITTATRRTPIITASQISNSRNQAAAATTTTNTTTATSDQPSVKEAAPRATPAKLSSTSATVVASAICNNQAPGKPPTKDLIDKIVSEIVRDANKEHDADCTIQDLSNCDISGIPETLDFDKCFQDVEMMTEEEARKLLSRKSESPSSRDLDKQLDNIDVQTELAQSDSQTKADETGEKLTDEFVVAKQLEGDHSNQMNVVAERSEAPAIFLESHQSIPKQSGGKSKVRFSEEPATIYDTHAASDYDRRNDDIDPVAASAEYEIEKSRERDGLTCDDDNDDEGDGQEEGAKRVQSEMMMMLTNRSAGVEAVIQRFNNQANSSLFKTFEEFRAGSHTQPTGALACHQSAMAGDDPLRESRDSSDNNNGLYSGSNNNNDEEDSAGSRNDYIEALEREVSLKRILEQNLRDLQSQYYDTVKQLDSFRGDAETRIAKLEDELVESRNQLETTQSELVDAREQSNQFEKQLNDIKESSQLLEKKYHRAKRIIKDMTSREESFVRREQLYQQKLDEIEYELGVLISTIDRTIYEDGLKYFTLLNTENGANNNNNNNTGNLCSKQHQTRLDVLGLIKRIMVRFDESKKSQSEQIKRRIATMLEQQLASLLANSNGCTSVTAGPVVPISPVAVQNPSSNIKPLNPIATANNNNNNDDNKHNQNYSYASHRLSQPNMPHPIGVGGQPTTIFHGLTNATPMMPLVAPLNEPSPPQSVNSYPSTNSLNSLNNASNNQHQQSSGAAKLHDAHQTTHEAPALDSAGGHQQPTSLLPDELFRASTTTTTAPPDVVQVPYQTNEWHDKPVSEWTTTQVSTWLLALGLDQYISKFEDRNVNGQSLINLDSTVLKGLGVLNSNDRNLLKKKIRELRTEMEKERKLMEKKMKENLKEKSKNQTGNGPAAAPSQNNRHSWKKGLLS